MSKLPDFRRLKIAQSRRRPTRQAFESFNHILVVVPAKPSAKILQKIPQGIQLRKLLTRAGGEFVSSRLGNANATGITLAAVAGTTPFEQLTWARRIIAECRRDNPGSLGIVAVGLDEDSRTNVLRNVVAAAEAAAFELPSFKSKRVKQRRLSSVKILGCDRRLDLRDVRAQALGNNIARWFTALPPNKLDARTYRQAVQELTKQHGIA
jgi:leucyl aminopeptidase